MGCQEMVAIWGGERMPGSAEIFDSMACREVGGGPPRAARFRLNMAGIWGMRGAAMQCRSVLKERGRDSMKAEMYVVLCV